MFKPSHKSFSLPISWQFCWLWWDNRQWKYVLFTGTAPGLNIHVAVCGEPGARLLKLCRNPQQMQVEFGEKNNNNNNFLKSNKSIYIWEKNVLSQERKYLFRFQLQIIIASKDVFAIIGLSFVCLSVNSITGKTYEWIVVKFYGGIQGGKRNKWINFGGDLDHCTDCPIGKQAISQQIISKFWCNFQDSSAMMQETIDFKLLKKWGFLWESVQHLLSVCEAVKLKASNKISHQ